MDIKLVLVEKEDANQNRIVGASATMLNQKYIITTANILSDIDKQATLGKLDPGKLHTNLFPNYENRINVVWTQDSLYTVQQAYIFAVFISSQIKNSNRHIFRSWAIDSIDNNADLNRLLSTFVILAFEETDDLLDLKKVLSEWWHLISSIRFTKSDGIFIRSVPFGNRNFIDSYSNGIVSNVFGDNSSMVLSDCPTTPGSEGSPVYAIDRKNDSKWPVGLVLASVSWWKGEWVGLTLIADMRAILLEVIDVPIKTYNFQNVHSKVLVTAESSLVQIHSGSSWGTAILLDEENGIFITNSHVIDNEEIRLYHKDRKWTASLIYQTGDSNALDLALIKLKTDGTKDMPLTQVKATKRIYNLGDTVFAAGFSLFPSDCQPTPTLTKGCISHLSPDMIKTTCSVHPGASGGAILDQEGTLLGIIVCNIKLHENHVVYPRVNAAVPFLLVRTVIMEYIKTADVTILNRLDLVNREAESVWRKITSKI